MVTSLNTLSLTEIPLEDLRCISKAIAAAHSEVNIGRAGKQLVHDRSHAQTPTTTALILKSDWFGAFHFKTEYTTNKAENPNKREQLPKENAFNNMQVENGFSHRVFPGYRKHPG